MSCLSTSAQRTRSRWTNRNPSRVTSTESRQRRRRFRGHEARVLELELRARLHDFRIHHDAVDGTHFLALRRLEVPDALGALRRVDLVDFRPLCDRLVRALGLAHVAVDALVGDELITDECIN